MRLGQHFLVNKNKLRKIIETLELQTADIVVEIGPGHGELTGELVNWLNSELGRGKLILIEKDKFLVESLREKYSQNKKIEVVEGDALRILSGLINKLTSKPINCKIVGNIPYYITGHLFRIIGELKNKPALIVFTIQREVAERVCAKSGQMNLLAASVQFWAEPKIIGRIPKNDFRPVPKVNSAIIKLLPRIYADNKRIDADKYYRFIKILFKQPRKTILNNLLEADKRGYIQIIEADKRGFLSKKIFLVGVNPSDRPQNLNIEQIRQLSTLFRGLL